MTKNLPSRQYNVFNSAFEKKIAEYQKNLMKINALERPYGLVKEVLLNYEGDEQIDLTMSEHGITVTFNPVDDSHFNSFEHIATEIGKKLFGARLHDDGEPSKTQYSMSISRLWRLNKNKELADIESFYPHVNYHMYAPTKGMDGLRVKVHSEVRTYTDTTYTYFPDPTYVAPRKPLRSNGLHIPF